MEASAENWRVRLDALVDRYGLTAAQRDQLALVLQVLARDESAPTSVRGVAEAIDVHVADSLVALELDVVRAARTAADLGAGAGFPGIPLAISLPETEISLLESQERKCRFLMTVLAQAGVENGRVVNVRAEEWPEGVERQDLVLARALAEQPVVVEYAAPLLRVGGSLVDWRGRRAPEQEEAARVAAAELGLERVAVLKVDPFPAARDRHVHVFEKVAETPVRFPRRAGVARKRPLGGQVSPQRSL
jgi:16S rRNA (guanine527-N7)-methyltransferase